MIQKISKGRGMRGLMGYLLGSRDHSGAHRPRHDILYQQTFSGTSSREIAHEFAVLRSLRPQLGRAVGHVSLRVPADERPLTDDEWRQIGRRWCMGMGIDSYVVVGHGGHIHIAFSRINTDGSVVSDSQDYKRGEAIVRRIEKEFGLRTIESSHLLEPEKALTHRQAPKMQEIALAEKGEVPAKQVIQDSLDAAITASSTVTAFIANLEAAGVDVRPNVSQTTRRLSGFSYALSGHVFTGSALGRGYSWGNLQKRGIDYDADRDLEAIDRCLARAADIALGAVAGTDNTGHGIEADDGGVAGINRRAIAGPGGIGSGAGRPEGDHGPFDPVGGGLDTTAGTVASYGPCESGGVDGLRTASECDGQRTVSQGVAERSTGFEDAEGGFDVSDSESPVAVLGGDVDSCDVGRSVGTAGFGENVMAWNDRFKMASAAQRREKEQQRRPDDMEHKAEFQRLCEAAHRADLVAYMRGLGMGVRQDGVNNYTVDDQYRVTRKDGRFLWCSWDSTRGGDPIDFCTKELGLEFAQALGDLAGSRLAPASRRETPQVGARFPSPPPTSQHPDTVTGYLEDRGVSPSVIMDAQSRGFLRLVDYDGVPGAAFCGYGPDRELRSMAVRLVRPVPTWNGDGTITKRDVRHSDKGFPAIWRGGDPNLPSDRSVWIVEGGIDGLAVVDWYRRHQVAAPCVIVSGGDGCRSFIDQPHVQTLLNRADTVYVALENEKNQDVQVKTDASHQKQIQKIQAMGLGCEVIAWRPPTGSKDVAAAWRDGALPDAQDPTAHMRHGGGGVRGGGCDAAQSSQQQVRISTSTPSPFD